MIQIAYNMTILGWGHVNPKARTGIFRAVEATFLELADRPELALSAVSINEETRILEEISSLMYLVDEYPALAKTFHRYHTSRLHLEGLYQQVLIWQKSLIQSRAQPGLSQKLARVLQIITSRISRLDTKTRPEDKYDVYHTSYFPFPSANLFKSAARVITMYDLIPLLFPDFVTPKTHTRFIQMLNSIDTDRDWVICISEKTKQDFCEYTKMNADRVFVAPLAAADYFQPVADSAARQAVLARHGIPDRPYLLSLSTLEPRKNLDFVIRCFGELIQAQPELDLNLVLVGVNGWKNLEIFAAARDERVRSRIIFTGYLPDQSLSAIYSGATAFLYPSLYEGFGLPPLEAMQCGTPVITSNTSSLPEVVGEAGLLIDPTQADQLMAAILQVVQDSALRQRLSEQALARSQQFSWGHCADRTVEVYRTAAAGRGQ
jgi:glycosyltransferase involved in cell wall biosynthesis